MKKIDNRLTEKLKSYTYEINTVLFELKYEIISAQS